MFLQFCNLDYINKMDELKIHRLQINICYKKSNYNKKKNNRHITSLFKYYIIIENVRQDFKFSEKSIINPA